jgi:hypothetical protein
MRRDSTNKKGVLRLRLRKNALDPLRIIAHSGVMEDPISDIEARSREINAPLSVILKEAGVHGSTWRRWKSERNSPTVSKLRKIYDAIDRLKKPSR